MVEVTSPRGGSFLDRNPARSLPIEFCLLYRPVLRGITSCLIFAFQSLSWQTLLNLYVLPRPGISIGRFTSSSKVFTLLPHQPARSSLGTSLGHAC